MNEIALAFDIGGTHIKAGVLDGSGNLLAIHREVTPAKSSPEQMVKRIFHLGQKLLRETNNKFNDIQGVGISIAAFITANGIVKATAHLSREWIGYDLKARLCSDWQTDLYFSLDTPAPTLGEAHYGAGKGIQDLVYVTVSTGIGAGILVDGKYFTGGLGWAGGVGHTIINEDSDRICEGCGNHGCLETFAATQGILATARELLAKHSHHKLLDAVNGKIEHLTPKILFEAAKKGDDVARDVFAKAGHALGIGLTNLSEIVAPTHIIIGGGIAQAGDFLLEPARQVIKEKAFPPGIKNVQVIQAALGDLSGLYGAAALVFHKIHLNTEENL